MHKFPFRGAEKVEVKPNQVSDTPVVSVCVQTYNHENYIKACLDGILMQQTNFEFEILLGEDDSKDNTRKICVEYANKFPDKIRLFLHDRDNVIYINGAPTGRYNFTYNLCNLKGKYIAICEGDDYWADPLKLQKQVDFLEQNLSYSFCFTRFKTLTNNSVFEEDKNSRYFTNDTDIDFNFEIFAKGWHIGTQTTLFRNKLYDPKWHLKYKYFKDVVLFTELLNKGKGACLNFFGAVYRKHDGGVYSGLDEFKVNESAYKTYKELCFYNNDNRYLKLKYSNFYNQYMMQLWPKNKVVFIKEYVRNFGLFEHNKLIIKRVFRKLLR